ncbi:MAG: TonB-dependent receptor plug domain-containing protein [Chitinophagaceae bacterium]
MRKAFFGTVLSLLFAAISSHAQNKFSGNIYAGTTPVSHASITISGENIKTIRLQSNDSGYFATDKVPLHQQVQLLILTVGKNPYRQTVDFGERFQPLRIELKDADNALEPLEVRAVRASDKAPFAKSQITAAQIAKVNTGKDLPYILNETPSVVVNSDAGNGIGYTGIRVRGSDASRTNVTINGIPYNDAESQGAYFVDIPDVVSSAQSIQIQRGVGTSTNGAGAFGATVNINTNEVHALPYANINNSYSSFNSWKNTVSTGTGLIGGHYYADVRLSHISSDGYIDRASSKLQSLFLSMGYQSEKTSIKFNFIAGKEKTYQAWNGVYEGNIVDPALGRRYNELGLKSDGTFYNDQTDNYVQNHYQLFWNQKLGEYLNLNVGSFLSRGYGYYQEYKTDASYTDYGIEPYVPATGDTINTTDLIRQRWLDNYFYGQTFALQYKKNADELTLGGAWTRYDGKHYGYVLWSQNGGVDNDYKYYGDLPAHKYDQNIYLKWLHGFDSYWNFFADAQYRHVKHDINGYDDDATLFVNRNFNFFNPKVGISYVRNGYNAFLSYALANKEPGRDDFETAPDQQPKREQLHDFELGVSKNEKNYNWGITLYYMRYKDQLVLTGKMNDVGGFTRINVPNSYRAGIELQGGYTFTDWLNANGNVTFSKNKIKDFTAYYDVYDDVYQSNSLDKQQEVSYHNTDISFSPNIVGSAVVNIQPFQNLELSLIGKYVGKQYLDNTQDDSRKINDYYNQDIRLTYSIKTSTIKQIDIIGYVYNAWNKMYYTNGAAYSYWVDGNTQPTNYNYYFPYAGTHYSMGVNISL